MRMSSHKMVSRNYEWYTGTVITWLKDDLKLIQSPGETKALARAANPGNRCYPVPAFSGLGSPYWDSDARSHRGHEPHDRKNEVVRAALDRSHIRPLIS